VLTHIDKPIRIRNLQLKNRVVRTATTTNLGGGIINEDLIAYHEARSRGVGLSILDVMSVHSTYLGPLYAFTPEELTARGIAVSTIGDARSPRYLQTAIREGYLEGAAV
jgi:2,4-dienoyl-CoA reductase-like NADH-dependent reductase (Old Yellow Enzyme family)